MRHDDEKIPFPISPGERPTGDAPMFDLPAMQATLKRNWRILAGFGAVGFLWALISLHVMEPTYSVEMVVTPVRATEESGSSHLSSLASLAGINLHGSDNVAPFDLYLESLTSRTVADSLASDKAFMHRLFASEWDERTQSWKRPRLSLASMVIGGIKGMLGYPSRPWHPPDGRTIQTYLNLQLSISQDPRKPYIATVELKTGNIARGVEILDKLNRAADEMLRQKALLRSKQYIAYLTQQLKVVSVTEQRDALANALNSQEQYIMTASAGSSYAADVFDAPHGSGAQVAPRPTTTYLRDIAFMIIIGSIFVLAGKAIGDRLRSSSAEAKWRAHADRLPQFMRRALQI